MAQLGAPSTSLTARAEALSEQTPRWLGPLFLTADGLRTLVTSPWVFGVLPAVGGFAVSARRPATRWLGAY